MKKAYVSPTVEKVEFQYDKVVAASGSCESVWKNEKEGACANGGNTWVSENN